MVQLAFFPLTLLSLIVDTIIADSVYYPGVWLIIFGFSFPISMLLGLGVTIPSIDFAHMQNRVRSKIRV